MYTYIVIFVIIVIVIGDCPQHYPMSLSTDLLDFFLKQLFSRVWWVGIEVTLTVSPISLHSSTFNRHCTTST